MRSQPSNFAPIRNNVGVFASQSIAFRLFFIGFSAFSLTYLLFQKKCFPKPISKIVSKILFWPTFPITALLRLGNHWTKVDDTLILGCAPMWAMGHPDKLYKLGVRGVVNMCTEYDGPKDDYQRLGIKQLQLPAVDHYEPSVEQMKQAVEFIGKYKKKGELVYVHCKAGHGRAASIALCWMISENRDKTAKELNSILGSRRKVRKTLFSQPNVMAFEQSLEK